ncbi:MAG: hypothetical protein BWY16_00473 [Candidatus Omnitrophica bacterium ADurb.Bin205]|nr:MAG: hypothetical protein BWY16_00473 [Candidatus Omnitrophica bacterium ADurb.Bin205]
MAETLGSLIDKLTIKDIREYHINQMVKSGRRKFSKNQLKEKLRILKRQKQEVIQEIDGFIAAALKGKLTLKDEKLKIYNDLKDMGRIVISKSMGQAISGLAKANLELWHLEDEARRKDASLGYIGKVKRMIDPVNQKRNDYIDRIDRLLEERISSLLRK